MKQWLKSFPSKYPKTFGFLLGVVFIQLGGGSVVMSLVADLPVVGPGLYWIDDKLAALSINASSCGFLSNAWDAVTVWSKKC